MKRKMNLCLMMLAFGFAVIVVFISQPAWAKRGGSGGRGDGPIIYVTSQDLYFDSIVTADPLPGHGPFQQLFPPGTNPDYPDLTTLSTEYGPRNPGYFGGRWWVDINGNGEMDGMYDHFFSCPLLGPGRVAP